MTKKVLYIIPIVLLFMVAFLVGFFAPDVSASWHAQMQRLPSTMSPLSGSSDKSEGNLPVLTTYYEVLTRLRENYYGKKIDDRELTYSAIRGMLLALNDPYTRFLDPDSYKKMREENEGNFVGIGAELDVKQDTQQVYIKEPLPDSPAKAAGVKTGDIIIKVDDKAISGLDIDEVVSRIRGEEGTRVKLTLLRGKPQKSVNVSIVRRTVEFRMVSYNMLDTKNGIGYIRLYGFNSNSDTQFEEAMSQLEKSKLNGLVFDLRRNPGGLLQVAIEIGSRFVESGPIVIIQDRNGREEQLKVDNSKHNHKRLPLVVLVDKNSASASEIVAGAIQDTKSGTLVGVQTFGKARVQTVSALNDGSAISITTAKYLTPKGTDINKVGVKPDIVIEEPEDIYEIGDPKTDVQLVKAIDVMKSKLNIKTSEPTVAKAPSK